MPQLLGAQGVSLPCHKGLHEKCNLTIKDCGCEHHRAAEQLPMFGWCEVCQDPLLQETEGQICAACERVIFRPEGA